MPEGPASAKGPQLGAPHSAHAGRPPGSYRGNRGNKANEIACCQAVSRALTNRVLHVIVATETETIGAKIRKAQLQKVRCSLLTGAKEGHAGTVVRRFGVTNDESAVPLKQCPADVKRGIAQNQ